MKSVSEEIQKDNSEISKIQANLDGQEVKINSVKKQIECKTSDLDDVIKNGELKKELLMIDVDYEADENLLPTLKMDLDSGCMTEEQQVYFSRGIAEVCTESKITSIDELNEILTILFNSEVIDNICNNSKLLELAEKKAKSEKNNGYWWNICTGFITVISFWWVKIDFGCRGCCCRDIWFDGYCRIWDFPVDSRSFPMEHGIIHYSNSFRRSLWRASYCHIFIRSSC